MSEHIKLIAIIIAIAATATVGTLFAIAYATYNPTSTASLPFQVFNGINIGDYFQTSLSSSSLSVVPTTSTGTPAPAITGCVITNDVHLRANDGSDYPLSSSSGPWSPTYPASVINNPYNGKTLSTVNIIVDLYCNPSTLAQYNYYPNLTGGTVNVSLQAKDPSGNTITIFSSSQQIDPAIVNGVTIPIAQFSVSASQISVALPTSPSNYLSQQSVITSGTLNFKQGPQAYQLTATHIINPLYTSFGLLISPSGSTSSQTTSTQPVSPVPAVTLSNQPTTQYAPVAPPTSTPVSCPSNTVSISNSCVNLIQNVYLAGGRTAYFLPNQNYLIYSVVVNSWNSGQPYPTVKITNLDTQTGQILTLSPGSRPSNGPIMASSGGALVVTDTLSFQNDLNNVPGRYQIQLMGTSLGTFNRPTVSQDFVLYNPNTSSNTGTVVNCPPGYYFNINQCQPVSTTTSAPPPSNPTNYASTTGTCPNGQSPVQTANGLICQYPSSSAPASGNSPVTLPTTQSNNVCVTLNGNSGACVPANQYLGNNSLLNSIQQLLLLFHAFG